LTVGGSSTPTTATVTFNSDGTLQSIASGGGTPITSGKASLSIGSVGTSTTPITLDLGTFGSSAGTTASTVTGATYNAGTMTQDGLVNGNFTSFTMETDGSVMANFDNGQTQMIAKVPLATFANANALQAQDGQAYTATSGSGPASLQFTGQNGAGTMEVNSVESSTTSLDTDLTKLIVAQQAYGASAKVVTTSEQMLQTVLSMKQ
jgi:flagellar hook protein FlgE